MYKKQHIVRSLLGADHKIVVPVSAFAGAFFLLWCDVAARVVVIPEELPIGLSLIHISPVFASIKGQFDSGVFEPQKLSMLSEIPFSELLYPLFERWCRNGLMEAVNDIYKLTPMGLFWQNQLNRAVMIAVQYLVYGPRVAGRKSALTMMSAMENRT